MNVMWWRTNCWMQFGVSSVWSTQEPWNVQQQRQLILVRSRNPSVNSTTPNNYSPLLPQWGGFLCVCLGRRKLLSNTLWWQRKCEKYPTFQWETERNDDDCRSPPWSVIIDCWCPSEVSFVKLFDPLFTGLWLKVDHPTSVLLLAQYGRRYLMAPKANCVLNDCH